MTYHIHGIRLPLRVTPGYRSDTYLCPICRYEEDRYQLRLDINGVPRRVDVSGDVCPSCARRFEIDDLK